MPSILQYDVIIIGAGAAGLFCATEAGKRRRKVLEIAKELDFLVIEDDPYGELLYVDDADITPMKAADTDERILYLGSFSKVLAPGLRCGWIAAAAPVIERLEIAKQAADLCSGMLDQSIVDEFCAAGELRPQIEKVRAFYEGNHEGIERAPHVHFQVTSASTRLVTQMFFPDHSLNACDRWYQAASDPTLLLAKQVDDHGDRLVLQWDIVIRAD